MNSNTKKTLRHKLFCHLDGVVIAPTAHALKTHGITDYLIKHKKASLDKLTDTFKANKGYLNVALRGLCSQGWLSQSVDNTDNTVHFQINKKSESAFKQFHLYEKVVQLLKISENYHPRKFEIEPFLKLEETYHWFKKIKNTNESITDLDKTIKKQILLHLEGIIVGPTTVFLGIKSMFHKYFMESKFKPEEFHENYEYFERLLTILTDLGWFELSKDSTFKFTDYGLFFAKRATAYGVTISYIPTLRKLEELIFGNHLILKPKTQESVELHVDREMNVWGSGGAHSSYFKILDEAVITIFNKPINEQPKGILDMGCGNGAFLKHLFTVIENNTLRGEMLDEYPLQLIGVDYNDAALLVTRKNLIEADIWAKVIWGDIGKPEQLAQDLKNNYDIELSDLLNVRTFLDHNRVWEEPKNLSPRITNSTGAFAYKGERIDNNRVAQSLKEHFIKWKPFIETHGLLLIELHTVKPELVAQKIGSTAATAYDLTHGYSDQYIIEIDEFLTIIEETGLIYDKNVFKKYPDSDIATVSINLLKSNTIV